MLNFYWNAVLKDGKSISQFTLEGVQNSFGLVQLQDKLKNLKRLELVCTEDSLVHLVVDLENGYFQIRGAIFHPYNALTMHMNELHYRIIFYRRKRQSLGTNMQLIGEPYTHRFLIGWQCTFKGLNYQRIMFYDPSSGGIEIKAKR